jgi:F-type H+-transporting ATPase subunit delta
MLRPHSFQRTRAFDVATDNPVMASMAGRYATALFDLAGEQRQLADVEANLVEFEKLLDASEDLRRLVRSPVFSADEQTKAIGAILDKAGIGGLTANFFRLIARNRRLFAASDMIKAFRSLAARARGEAQAEVVSAQALSDQQMQQLKDSLRASVGKDVQITAKVDPALLGGLVVKVGSRMIDSSLRTKLNSLKNAMKEVG